MARRRDRALLQTHCHSAAKRILEASGDERAVREAVTYLSIAIMASGDMLSILTSTYRPKLNLGIQLNRTVVSAVL